MLKWFLDRAKERSTWIGIVGLAGAAGLAFNAAQVEAVITAAIAVAGAIAVFTADKPPAE